MNIFGFKRHTYTKFDGSPIWTEYKALFKIAGPCIVTLVLEEILEVFSLLSIGHFSGSTELAAASLGLSFVNVLAIAAGTGFCTAVETLCAQAYGAGNLLAVGLIAQRAAVIMILIYLPGLAICLFSEDILIVMGQDLKIAALSGEFIRGLSIGLLPLFWFQIGAAFLQAQSVAHPATIISGIVASISLPINYLFMRVADLGIFGGALAVSCCNVLLFLGLVIYVKVRHLHVGVWPPLSLDIFHGWKGIIHLGFPGGCMVLLEWLALEVIIFFTGWLGTVELAVASIAMKTVSVFYLLPAGFAAAGMTRIGNAIGAYRVADARFISCLTVVACVAISIFLSSLLLVLKDVWGFIFTKDMIVVNLLSTMIAFVALLHLVDTVQSTLSAIIRSCGRQKVGALVNLAGYYVVGIPLGYVLAFRMDMGLNGLWVGLLAGQSVSACLYFWSLSSADWEKYSRDAVRQLAEDSEQSLAQVTKDISVIEPESNTLESNDIEIGVVCFHDGELVVNCSADLPVEYEVPLPPIIVPDNVVLIAPEDEDSTPV